MHDFRKALRAADGPVGSRPWLVTISEAAESASAVAFQQQVEFEAQCVAAADAAERDAAGLAPERKLADVPTEIVETALALIATKCDFISLFTLQRTSKMMRRIATEEAKQRLSRSRFALRIGTNGVHLSDGGAAAIDYYDDSNIFDQLDADIDPYDRSDWSLSTYSELPYPIKLSYVPGTVDDQAWATFRPAGGDYLRLDITTLRGLCREKKLEYNPDLKDAGALRALLEASDRRHSGGGSKSAASVGNPTKSKAKDASGAGRSGGAAAKPKAASSGRGLPVGTPVKTDAGKTFTFEWTSKNAAFEINDEDGDDGDELRKSYLGQKIKLFWYPPQNTARPAFQPAVRFAEWTDAPNHDGGQMLGTYSIGPTQKEAAVSKPPLEKRCTGVVMDYSVRGGRSKSSRHYIGKCAIKSLRINFGALLQIAAAREVSKHESRVRNSESKPLTVSEVNYGREVVEPLKRFAVPSPRAPTCGSAAAAAEGSGGAGSGGGAGGGKGKSKRSNDEPRKARGKRRKP